VLNKKFGVMWVPVWVLVWVLRLGQEWVRVLDLELVLMVDPGVGPGVAAGFGSRVGPAVGDLFDGEVGKSLTSGFANDLYINQLLSHLIKDLTSRFVGAQIAFLWQI
jgi:hypothetical protein